jgi:hypothetical protein
MSDNIDFGPGRLIASKDVGSGVQHQRLILGGRAQNAAANQAAAANAAQVEAMFDDLGRQVALLNQTRERVVQGFVTHTIAFNAADPDSTVLAAGGSGVFRDLVLVVASNPGSANQFELRDGSTVVLSFDLAANASIVIPLPVPIPGTANTTWKFRNLVTAAVYSCHIFLQAVENV